MKKNIKNLFNKKKGLNPYIKTNDANVDINIIANITIAITFPIFSFFNLITLVNYTIFLIKKEYFFINLIFLIR